MAATPAPCRHCERSNPLGFTTSLSRFATSHRDRSNQFFLDCFLYLAFYALRVLFKNWCLFVFCSLLFVVF